MIRPPLLILAAAAVLAAGVTLWPVQEPDTVAPGVLPASSGPRLAEADTAMEEASSAARMTRFAAAGAPVAVTENSEAAPPPPPRPDETPVLVGVLGSDGALTGYFSTNGLSVRARRGDLVDGWRVAALGRRDARLIRGGKVLKLSLFAARGGPLSPAMAAPERRVAVAPTDAPAVIGPAVPAGPPKARRVRKPLPPLPPGSKGWWSGPPGSKPPPGYTQMPRLTD